MQFQPPQTPVEEEAWEQFKNRPQPGGLIIGAAIVGSYDVAIAEGLGFIVFG